MRTNTIKRQTLAEIGMRAGCLAEMFHRMATGNAPDDVPNYPKTFQWIALHTQEIVRLSNLYGAIVALQGFTKWPEITDGESL